MSLNTISWLHYQDIQVNNISTRIQFNQAMTNGDYVEALRILNRNGNELKGKAFISETITTIINGILNLENRFTNNVTLFLSNLAVKYDEMIKNFKDMKEWHKALEYVPYNFVSYKDKVYMALNDIPVNTKPTDSTDWLELGLIGKAGAPGVDVVMRYNWDKLKNYVAHDLVVYGDNIYVALKQNNGVTPGTDESTWLTFIMTSAGKITVSNVAPVHPVNNEIWFQTAVEPLGSTQNLQGVFNRWNKNNQWEQMYPETLFTWVVGTEGYAPYSVYYEVDIKPEDWTHVDEMYEYRYTNFEIKSTSLVEVAPNNFKTKAQTELYNSLSAETSADYIKLITDKEPTINLPVNIKIQ